MSDLKALIENRLYEDIGGNNITLQPSSDNDIKAIHRFVSGKGIKNLQLATDTRGRNYVIIPKNRESKEGVELIRALRKRAEFVDVTGNNLTQRDVKPLNLDEI